MREASLVLLAGCNAVFGIDTAVGPIEGKVDFVVVDNDASFMPTVQARPYTGFELVVYVVDAAGSATPVTYHDDTGTFEVPRADDRTRIQLRFGRTVFEYQWAAPALTVHEVAFSRSGAAQATAATKLTGNVTLPLPSLLTIVYVTGLWERVIPAFDAVGFHADWSGGLPSTAAHDQMIFAGYEATPEGAVVLDQAAAIPMIEMTPDANDLGEVTLAKLPLTSCVHAVGDVAADAARLDALYPTFGALPASASIEVLALPQPALAPASPWLLAIAPNLLGDATLHYEPIFPGLTPMIVTVIQRAGALPDGSSIAVSTLSYQGIDSTTCAAPIDVVPHDVAIPAAFALGGQPIDRDGVEVALPSPTLELTWQADGRAELFQVQIYDVTATTSVVPHALFTTAPHATLDASDFTAGRRYVFVVRVDVGLPGIALGDLTTRSYPGQQAVVVSPVFTVR